jgi:DNA-binding NtrC family response regulator
MTDAGSPTRPSVLFVDDEPRILVALKAIFRGSYETHTADGGEAAVELLRQRDFDVVVSDQRMPGMSGIEVLRQARKLRPRAIRVLLTGYSDLDATVDAINEGEVFRFVSKPWSNEQLRATLAAAVRAAAVDEPAAPVQTAAIAAPGTPAAVGVLILEPEAQTRESLRAALNGGHPVHCAAELEEGISLLGRHRIGVLITELLVDGEDLTAALGTLRQYDPSLVAVVLTSQADAVRTINLINQSQIYRLLRKPVSDQLLRGTVNLALQRFANQQRNPELVRRHETEAVVDTPARKNGESMMARIKRLLFLR